MIHKTDKKESVTISESRLRELVFEEMIKLVREEKEEQPKASHEISAAANALASAIDAFEAEDLPEVPSELTTALKVAKQILSNMADNPGRYKGLPPSTTTETR